MRIDYAAMSDDELETLAADRPMAMHTILARRELDHRERVVAERNRRI